VKLEMLIGHVRPLSCYKKKPQNSLIAPRRLPPNSPDLNPVNCSVWKLLQKLYKARITDLEALKQRLRSRPSWIMSSLQQPFVIGNRR